MNKNFRKIMKAAIPAIILAKLCAVVFVEAEKTPFIPEAYIETLERVSSSFVPVALIIGLLVLIMPMLKKSHDIKDLEASSWLYTFTTVFITFFGVSYIAEFFELKEAVMILAILIVITLVARLILKAVDNLDELWRKICYEACCLGSYITLGFSIMYALVAAHFIELPDFQPEWCAYAIVFFSMIGFMFVRFKYTYEE